MKSQKSRSIENQRTKTGCEQIKYVHKKINNERGIDINNLVGDQRLNLGYSYEKCNKVFVVVAILFAALVDISISIDKCSSSLIINSTQFSIVSTQNHHHHHHQNGFDVGQDSVQMENPKMYLMIDGTNGEMNMNKKKEKNNWRHTSTKYRLYCR